MSAQHSTVTTEIELHLIVGDGPDRPVRADVDFSVDDPYAVRVGFHTGVDETVVWTFARALLTDGVTHPVGCGDVQVWPATARGHSTVCLALSSPSGRALFEAPLAAIVQFLARTYAIVPTGMESDFVDLDAELAELLASEER